MVRASDGDYSGLSGRQWADAILVVNKHELRSDPNATYFELKKTVEVDGETFQKSFWLNIHQLRAIARDHCF